MTEASTVLPSDSSSTMAASSIHGTGAQNFSNAMRRGCALVSGMEFGPNFSRRRRASSLVRPVGAAAFASAPDRAVETFSLTVGDGMDVIQSDFRRRPPVHCPSRDVTGRSTMSFVKFIARRMQSYCRAPRTKGLLRGRLRRVLRRLDLR